MTRELDEYKRTVHDYVENELTGGDCGDDAHSFTDVYAGHMITACETMPAGVGVEWFVTGGLSLPSLA